MLLLAYAACAMAADKEPADLPMRLVAELADGSKLIGTPLTSSVPVHTSYASMDIPFSNLTEIVMGAEDKKAVLTLKNGDTLDVTIDVDALPLSTLNGDLSIHLKQILRVTQALAVEPPGVAAEEALPPATTVRARHILVAAKPKAGHAERAEKQRLAEKIRKQLADGADFAEMAKMHSDCPSKQRGGDLGTFKKGQMVKPFEHAAFTQKVDAIGPVVETQFGYHIVQVTERHVKQ
jgi:parvulin-like peptidyl-prolyl isomerase